MDCTVNAFDIMISARLSDYGPRKTRYDSIIADLFSIGNVAA